MDKDILLYEKILREVIDGKVTEISVAKKYLKDIEYLGTRFCNRAFAKHMKVSASSPLKYITYELNEILDELDPKEFP